jgi:ribonucleoside-diphosphate reductase alpha chain
MVYQQAPYAEITEAEYQERKEKFPIIDWSRLPEFEKEDTTTSTKELACSAGVCEVVDLGNAEQGNS